MDEKEFDILVLGGGVAGVVAATSAAQQGARVGIVEKDKTGCSHKGSIPSKALIHSAKVASLVRRAREFGLSATLKKVDATKVAKRVFDVVKQVRPKGRAGLEKHGVPVLSGTAQFVSPHEILLGDELFKAKSFIIATGTTPVLPDIPGLDKADFITSENVFSITKIPASIGIIGAGPVGTELAQAWDRLGSRVTLIEKCPHILPKEDEEVAMQLQEVLKNEGISIYCDARVEGVMEDRGKKTLSLRHEGRDRKLRFDEILVAIGRRPNIESLQLDKAYVKTYPQGVIVDASLRTSQKHIFAAGDVTGRFLFVHTATEQGRIAAANALGGTEQVNEYAVPWVTSTDPELARVGMTEGEAQARGVHHEVYKADFKDVDKAIAIGETAGMVKIVCAPGAGKILGAHILGPDAGNLLQEFVLAMNEGISLRQISHVLQAYPTLAEINKKVADKCKGSQGQSSKLKRFVSRFV